MNFRLTYVSPSVTRLRGYDVEEALVSEGLGLTPSSHRTAAKVFEEELAAEKANQEDPLDSGPWSLR